MKRPILLSLPVLVVLALVTALLWQGLPPRAPASWSAEELALIRSLSLSQLGPVPVDASNQVADSPRAAALGRALYFDTRLSSNGNVACATCHQPARYFSDGLPLAVVGNTPGPRHTPSLVGLAYSPWFYWDGRKDSLWSQALAPLEAGHEHDLDRLQVVRRTLNDSKLRHLYEQVFGPAPKLPEQPRAASPLGNEQARQGWQQLDKAGRRTIDRVFSNLGKALAAYQRKLLPGRSRFDDYADSLREGDGARGSGILTPTEIAGLKLFIGEAQCVNCHNGPLFTNFDFHNTGVLAVAGQLPSMGRYDGIREARQDPFNCLGNYSDSSGEQCLELRFARDTNDLVGAQKTPTLRNVTETAPYMHGGQLNTLAEVMIHYNKAPVSMLSHNEAKPLGLRPAQLRQLEAFMATLTAPLATEAKWLRPAVHQEQQGTDDADPVPTL